MVFLYRHYLELALKEQLWKMYDACRFYQEAKNHRKLGELLQTHSLTTLSRKFEGALHELWRKTLDESTRQKFLKDTQSDVRHLFKVCSDLDDLDKKSLGCRYPINNKRQFYYTGKEKVNIVLFVEALQQVYTFLCGANAELDNAIEWIRE